MGLIQFQNADGVTRRREVTLPLNRPAYARLLAKLQADSKAEKRNLRLQFTTDPRMR